MRCFLSGLPRPSTRRLALILLLTYWVPVQADVTVAPEYASLVEKVLQQDPKTAQSEDWQHLNQVYQAQAQRWFSEPWMLNLHYEDDRLLSDEGIRNLEIGGQVTFQRPVIRQQLGRIAQVYQSLPKVQREYLQWQASGKVRELSWQLKRTQQEQQLAQTALAQSQVLQRQVERKKQAGEATQMEWLLAQAEVVKQQRELSLATNQLTQSEASFRFWTQNQSLPSSLVEPNLAALPVEQHPQLQWLSAQQHLAETELQFTRSALKSGPSVYFGTKQDRLPGPDQQTLVAELSLPFGSSSHQSLTLAQDQAKLSEQKIQRQQAELTLQTERLSAEQALAQLQAQRVLEQQNLDLNQQKLTMVEKAYQLGAVSIESVLRIQQDFLTAQRQLSALELELGWRQAHLNYVNGHRLVAQ
ncbi:MAG: TolC family protein [Thiotrichales bacterium]|nr:TolC family protein [Thiotrichales bacterium]